MTTMGPTSCNGRRRSGLPLRAAALTDDGLMTPRVGSDRVAGVGELHSLVSTLFVLPRPVFAPPPVRLEHSEGEDVINPVGVLATHQAAASAPGCQRGWLLARNRRTR